MSSSDFDNSTEVAVNGGLGSAHPTLSTGSSESLGLLVWLSQLLQRTDEQGRAVVDPLRDAPRMVGRFRLEALLGFGAYGAVFRAFDTHLGRNVALKIAWPAILMDPVTSRRFTDEPKTVALLKHPGIVEVYDSGNFDLVWYIAFELVKGPSLAEWLKDQQQVQPRLAAEIVRRVALAVDYAHEHEVIHRDLKPSNILLRPGTADGRLPFEPVVTDFGLAQRPRTAEMSLLTATQAVLGTDHYMSPEQTAGTTAEVGYSSDIFSLGVILYELVTGERPFDAASSDDIRRKIREDEPTPIGHGHNGIPRDLETVISKCLQKSPRRRYATAGDLAADLGRFLNHEPILARPVGLLDRAWKYTNRKPMVVAFATVVALGSLLVAGLGGAWISDRMSAADEVAAAQAATAVAVGIERQHQYASNIQHAAEALRHGRRREVLELLQQCRSLVPTNGRCGIEWDWIWAEANRADKTIHAHVGGVSAVRFSPLGGLLATGGKDGRVGFWSTESWTKNCDLKYAEDQEVDAVEFSNDGSLLAVGGDDGRLVVYRVDNRSVIYDESIIDGRVFDLAWVGESTEIAVGGDGAVLKIVDPLTGSRRQTTLEVSQIERAAFGDHPDEISAVTYARSTNAIGVFMTPPSTYFIDPRSLAVVTPSLAKRAVVGAVCGIFSEQCYIAATTGELGVGSVDLFKVSDGSVAASVNFPGHVQVMRFSPATKRLAAGFLDGAIQTRKIESLLAQEPAEDGRLCAHGDRVASLDFSPDGKRLVSGGWDGDVKLWNVASLNEPFDVALNATPLRAEFSPCDRWLGVAVESEAGEWRLNVLDGRSGALLWSKEFSTTWGAGAKSWAYDPSGDEIALAEGASVSTFDAPTGQRKATYSLPARDGNTWVTYSLDRRSLLVSWPYVDAVSLNRTTGIRDDGLGESARASLRMVRTVRGDVWVDIEPSHALVLRAAGAVEPIMVLPGPSEKVSHTAVSRDGHLLAAGGPEGIVYFWHLNNSSLHGKCVGHGAKITDVKFSPDGRGIFSASEDGTVRLWDVATRAELLRFGSPQQPVVSMALNREGTLLVLGIKDGNRYGLRIHRLGESSGSLMRNLQSF